MIVEGKAVVVKTFFRYYCNERGQTRAAPSKTTRIAEPYTFYWMTIGNLWSIDQG